MERKLKLLEVFCISSGAMISSGLFILPGIAYGQAGPAVIVSYVIASLLALPTVLAKAELATAMPKTGGIFFFTDRSMGPMMGTLGGLSAWFSLALKSAFALFGLGVFATLVAPSIGTMEVRMIAVGFCLFFMVINILGAKLSARFQVWMVTSLIGILLVYILIGLFFIDTGNYSKPFGKGLTPIVSTSGLVFVSFAGSTKIAAVAGEVKKPGRNLPAGILLSWGVVSLLYIATIAVTVGVLGGDLSESATPISDSGGIILGTVGIAVMSISGILAFVSTGNSGILTASRDPMAMGKDHLLPENFGNLSRWGTPWFSIILTASFMIAVIMLTDVKRLAEYASTLKLLLFVLACLALIFMRESNMKHYRPKFRAPFYPWAQIIGVAGYSVLIATLGWEKLLVALGFIVLGLLWYFVYAYGKIKREYALLHVAERITGEDTKTGYLLDEELREILIDRDQVLRSRLNEKIMEAQVIDMNYIPPPSELSRKLAYTFSERIGLEEDYLEQEFRSEDRSAHMMSMPNFIILSYRVKGRDIFEMAIIRTRRGAIFSRDSPPVHAAFVILFSKDEKSFYLNSLMWLTGSCKEIDFGKEWVGAETKEDLKHLMTRECGK